MSTPAAASTNTPRKAPLWRNLSFTLMWTSTAASGFGDRMIMLAALALLGGMVAGVDSTSTQASTQFWFFLPYIGFSVIGGWLADHLPRKWLLLTCDEIRGLVLLFAAYLTSNLSGSAEIPKDSVWFTLPGFGYEIAAHCKVYATLFVIGTFAAIFNPTRNAIIPQIIPGPQLTAGNAVILVINVIASQIGLLLGKQLISQDDATTVHTCLFIGAAFYLVSGSFFAFLKPVDRVSLPTRARTDGSRSFLHAARYVSRHHRVVALILLNILIWPSAAIVTSGLFGLGKMHYDLAGDALLAHFANLSVTLGVGMLLGAAMVSFIHVRKESPIVYLSGLLLAGLGVVLLGLIPSLTIAYLACLTIGIGGNLTIVGVLTMLQSITPNYVRGRVMGLNSLLNTVFSVLTYFMIWRLPSADTNILYALYALGTLLIIVGETGLFRYLTHGPMPNRTANLLYRIDRLFCMVWHRLTLIDKHNVPTTGPVILAANHTSALDPFIMQAGTPRMIRWVMLTQYQLKIAGFMWRAIRPIALDRDSGDITKLREVVNALKQGDIVGLYPEGGLQRKKRELGPMEPGIGMIAKRSGATIVPVWIDGTPLRNSMTLHMIQPSRSTVIFGKPYTPDKKQDAKEITEDLRQRLLALSEKV